MPRLELVATLEGHQDRVWQASWHPSKTVLATCSGDKTVRLWAPASHSDFTQWQCIDTLDGAHKRTIRSVAWSPSGNELATASFDATTGIWETDPRGTDWDCVATLEGHENEIKSVAWSSSGSLLATCSRDKSVWIWEVESDNDFECLSVLQEHTQDVKMVAWHPQQEVLASASYDDTIKIWKEDEDDWYCADTLEGHTSTVWALDFDASGDHIVSASDDRTLRIWKTYKPNNPEGIATPNGEPVWKTICTLSGYHDRCIYSVSWSKVNGYIASASGDNAIRIFAKDDKSPQDANAPTYTSIADVQDAHGVHDINGVSWFPTAAHADWLASVGDDGLVRIWRLVLDN
ncbi:cytosolic iron-sulfur protein assembly [Apophysomyces sp. BC1034]|nr:cytosolic iron-sulfur protein assembly [Apophysomyces sp. BC1015]KAG0176881.1 cytosolic iron-sulfur protein assembly [Apophysomyces sp. BC1021]KAG0187142.1 cytosolic iron-sulfur protein assembly [Apophysomyces sp. BC1034]